MGLGLRGSSARCELDQGPHARVHILSNIMFRSLKYPVPSFYKESRNTMLDIFRPLYNIPENSYSIVPPGMLGGFMEATTIPGLQSGSFPNSQETLLPSF